ncbi:hypothetical protein B0H11DRAFT_2264888 [Mycena galericulata]|nr:hypothetical protein B0H11DRAFT_2264888 [Mycena galericulata]
MAYMAPEILAERYNIDWWSLGVCAYKFIFWRRPFRGGTNSDLRYSITKNPLKWPENAEKKCSQHGMQILKGLLDLDVLAASEQTPPFAKKANFDASHELEELLLEDNPLKAKTRKTSRRISPRRLHCISALLHTRLRFMSYDFKKMQRRSYLPPQSTHLHRHSDILRGGVLTASSLDLQSGHVEAMRTERMIMTEKDYQKS